MMMKNLLFPIWQPNQQEYQAVCAYLGLSPRTHLYEKLSDYLSKAPFRFARPKGLALYLAKPRLTRFRIARLDLTSKLFFPDHPIRHILNGVIALHECDGEGYAELSAAPSWAVSLSLLGWAFSFTASLFITTGWLCWYFMLYLVGAPLRPAADLTGKRILITGANRGLGRDLLLHSLQQGAQVTGTVRNRESLDALRTLLPKEAPVQLHVADLSQTGALVKALQEGQVSPDRIDIAVLCAGIKYAGASAMDIPKLRDTFEVNYFSSVELADWLYGSAHKATLVLISSIGRWHGMHSSCGYNASKASLSIWGESLEMELHLAGKQECKVMVVEPGIFESGMMTQKVVSKLLFASRRELAIRILSGAQQGRKVLRYPFWFALLTWTVCLGGRGLRYRLFARNSKQGSP
ncbi:MAG: SDR family NAD(P)-dependent oxidoreductase [Pseudomonadota bacterium]